MGLDLFLAVLHHLVAFGLVATVMTEAVVIRWGVSGARLDRLARLDASYGASAALLVVIGVIRVIFGAKGYEYYLQNPWFWAKMASFLAVGLMSIAPTMRILNWRRTARGTADYEPPAAEVKGVMNWLRLESLGLVLVIIFAATMARFN